VVWMIGKYWKLVKDGDKLGRALYRRHYSRNPWTVARRSKLFVGPGEKMVLVGHLGDALFVWRKFVSRDGQVGVNCAVFRNEGTCLSSEMILEAEEWAWGRWVGERLYTYVNAEKVRSSNPGYCFMKAGWVRVGQFGRNKLVLLEKNWKVQSG
jgi:hypothetical protein